jgi:hypothetical protein
MWVDTSTSIDSHHSPLIISPTRCWTFHRRLTGDGHDDYNPSQLRQVGQSHAQQPVESCLTWQLARTVVTSAADEASFVDPLGSCWEDESS